MDLTSGSSRLMNRGLEDKLAWTEPDADLPRLERLTDQLATEDAQADAALVIGLATFGTWSSTRARRGGRFPTNSAVKDVPVLS